MKELTKENAELLSKFWVCSYVKSLKLTRELEKIKSLMPEFVRISGSYFEGDFQAEATKEGLAWAEKKIWQKRIYVASSWRNDIQPKVVKYLRSIGHEVYDFKNPEGKTGFSWSQIDENWQNWTNEEYLNALEHPLAKAGYKSDFDAMKWADTFVLVLPCGRSAHLEAGWAAGMGKHTVLLLDEMEPELMVKMIDKILPDMKSFCEYFKEFI